MPYGPQISAPLLQNIFEHSPNSDLYNTADDDFQCNIYDDPQLLNQSKHSTLIRDFGLYKPKVRVCAEILGSRRKEET